MLVVGDGSRQRGCLVGVLHPRQVGAFLGVVAPTLQGEVSVPGRLRETGGACSPVYPAALTSASSQLRASEKYLKQLREK